MSRRSAYAGLVTLALLGLAGCGEQPGYDSSAVESYLVRSQAATFANGTHIGKARCPGDLELKEGMTIRCTLDVGKDAVPYRVRLTHVRARTVTVAASPAGVLMSGRTVRDFVRSTLPKSSSAADVDCGGAYFVAQVGQTLDCRLTLGAQQKPIKLTVKDRSGVVTVGS